MVFASSDVGVETIAVLGFDAEELVHGLRQVLELHIAIIHASHDADAINHFYKVNGIVEKSVSINMLYSMLLSLLWVCTNLMFLCAHHLLVQYLCRSKTD